jgi:hypothetical protein
MIDCCFEDAQKYFQISENYRSGLQLLMLAILNQISSILKNAAVCKEEQRRKI